MEVNSVPLRLLRRRVRLAISESGRYRQYLFLVEPMFVTVSAETRGCSLECPAVGIRPRNVSLKGSGAYFFLNPGYSKSR